MLPAMNAIMQTAAAQLPIEVTLAEADEDSADRLTYTFSGKSIGAEHGTREIFVFVVADALAGDVSAVTVGGNSCTKVQDHLNGPRYAGIWQLDTDPGGTTADVVVTCPDTASRLGIGVIRVINWASKAAHHTNGGSTSLSLNIPEAGFALVAAYSEAASVVMTGITERYDRKFTESNTANIGGFDSDMAAETGRAISIDAGNGAMFGASFSP